MHINWGFLSEGLQFGGVISGWVISAIRLEHRDVMTCHCYVMSERACLVHKRARLVHITLCNCRRQEKRERKLHSTRYITLHNAVDESRVHCLLLYGPSNTGSGVTYTG